MVESSGCRATGPPKLGVLCVPSMGGGSSRPGPSQRSPDSLMAKAQTPARVSGSLVDFLQVCRDVDIGSSLHPKMMQPSS
jgi:hypothetical protein